jgi:hypothetical protein
MGEKKQKEAAQQKWKKVLFVIAAVLFVFVMVVSSMGTHWITGLAPIKAGDQVVIGYTLYDAMGTPFITSSQPLFKQTLENGQVIMYTKSLSLTANRTASQALFPIEIYVPTNGGSWEKFGLNNQEIDTLSNSVVGMRTGETKKVPFTYTESMSSLFSAEDLATVNLNMSSLAVGDSLTMGVSDNPNASITNSTANIYLRFGDVTRKTDSGVVVDFGYPYAEITVESFTNS